MKKQFTIFLILFFILGLMPTNFIKTVGAQTDLGLISYWDFEDKDNINAGLISDKTGNYNGQNITGTWISDGHDGGAINFPNCTTEYSNQCGMSANSVSSVSNFSFLFRLKSNGENNGRSIVSSHGFHINIIDQDSLLFLGDGMIGGSNGVTITTSNLNTWNHFALIYNEDGYYFYLNGSLNKFISILPRNIPIKQFFFDVDNVQFDDIKFYNKIGRASCRERV